MRGAIVTALVGVLMITGCGRVAESRVNPFNWFGGDREERVASTTTAPEAATLIEEVTQLKIDAAPGGVIISVIGRASRQGYWQAELVPILQDVGDTLVLEFQIEPPEGTEPVGAAAAREVLTGKFISSQDLGGVRQVTVVAAQNRRSVRRR